MASDSPYTIRVYDRALGWLGNIGAPQALTGSVLQHAPGSFQLTLDPGDPLVDDVMAPGARIAIDYLDAPLFSGMRRPASGSLTNAGNVQCTIQGDRRVLDNHLALIVPSGPIVPTTLAGSSAGRLAQAVQSDVVGADGTAAGQTGYMVWPASVSSAEAAIKWVLSANLGRSREPVTIAPNLDRGGNARAAGVLPLVRMSSISEAVQPILDWSGLTLQVLRTTAGQLVAEVSEPHEWPALTAAAGIVTAGSWSIAPPSITRAYIGGPGQDASRAFFRVDDATGIEAEWNDSIEVFRDATGAQLAWPQGLDQSLQVAKYYLLRTDVTDANKALFRAYIAAAASDAMDDGAATTSISATLSETDDFHFGGTDGLRLGDVVPVVAASGAEFSDVVTEAQFSYTADAGSKVTPVLGELNNNPDRAQARLIARLFAAQRRQARNR